MSSTSKLSVGRHCAVVRNCKRRSVVIGLKTPAHLAAFNFAGNVVLAVVSFAFSCQFRVFLSEVTGRVRLLHHDGVDLPLAGDGSRTLCLGKAGGSEGEESERNFHLSSFQSESWDEMRRRRSEPAEPMGSS